MNLELRAHGGVIIFVKNDYSFVQRYLEHSTNNIEALGLDIFERRRSGRGHTMVPEESRLIMRLVCYYRRPRSNKQIFLKWLQQVFQDNTRLSNNLKRKLTGRNYKYNVTVTFYFL